LKHPYFRGLAETSVTNENINILEAKPKSGYENQFSTKTNNPPERSAYNERNVSGRKLTWNPEKSTVGKRSDSTETRKTLHRQSPVKSSMDEFDELLQDFDKKYANNKINMNVNNKISNSKPQGLKSPQKFYLYPENSSYLDTIKNTNRKPLKTDLKEIKPNDTLSDILNESFVKKFMMDSMEPSAKYKNPSRKIGVANMSDNLFADNLNMGTGNGKKRSDSRLLNDENTLLNTLANGKDASVDRATFSIPTYSKSIIKKSTTTHRVKDDLLDELFGDESFSIRKKSSRPAKTPDNFNNKPSYYLPSNKANMNKYEDIFLNDQYMKDKQYNTRRSRYVPAYSNWKNDFDLIDNKWNNQPIIQNPPPVYNPDKDIKKELLTTYIPRFNDSALNDKAKRGKL
jgi:hypothetical protein